MHFSNFMSFMSKIKVPPTRGLRYKTAPYNIVIKNSYKMPAIKENRPSYRTFTVCWNEEMTFYKLKDTTPLRNKTRNKNNIYS